MVDLTQYCRLCAEISDFKMHSIRDDNVQLWDSIDRYLSIKINADDSLPICVCEQCRFTVATFQQFAFKCFAAQLALQSLLEQKDIKFANSLIDDNDDPMVDDLMIANAMSDHDAEMLEDFKHEVLTDEESDASDEHPLARTVKKLKKYGKVKKEKDPDFEPVSTPKKKIKSLDTEFKQKKIKKKISPNYKTKRLKDPPVKKKGLTDYTFFKYKCHLCPKEFRRLNHLESHTRDDHSTSLKILCTCGEYLTSRSNVIRHIRNHTSPDSDNRCVTCDILFPTLRAFKKHKRAHHPPNTVYTCDECPKEFKKLYYLDKHKTSHLPYEIRAIHKCESCETKFLNKSQLKSHVDVVHKKIVSFVCHVCGRTFQTASSLFYHKSTHSDERAYACTKCPKKFKTKHRLKVHTDCHSGTSYKCPQCPSLLNSKATLRCHLKVHEDIFRYKCGFCQKVYKRKKALTCHMHRHTGNRPYVCLWCPKTFVDNSNLRDHKLRMHKKELKEYEETHGPPKGAVRKLENISDVAKETTVIKLAPKRLPANVVVLPKQLNIEPLPMDFFPDFNTNFNQP